ncbi:MAG: SPFH domain-containing protein [Marinibacterium sp.]|nr:SPFH domain-containing protein [Marinibacterium sp.]
MRILDFLKGDFIDVIHWLDDGADRLVWRFDRQGHAIRYGAKLTVREGQAAVFVHEGVIADVFAPGLYMLETNTMPVLTRLQHWDHGFRSPFKSEIYFIDTTRVTGLKWGTKTPVLLRDPDLGAVRLRAFGTYSIRVTDPARFLAEIVGTDASLTADEISFQIRSLIMQDFARVVAGSGLGVLDMAANTGDLGQMVARHIAPVLDGYGLSMPDFVIASLSLPGDAQDALDAALRARAPGGLRRATPPPPAPDQLWHLARGGDTYGPYPTRQLAEMAQLGDLRPDMHVWTDGQGDWQRAGDVPALATLFASRPPPPPKD